MIKLRSNGQIEKNSKARLWGCLKVLNINVTNVVRSSVYLTIDPALIPCNLINRWRSRSCPENNVQVTATHPRPHVTAATATTLFCEGRRENRLCMCVSERERGRESITDVRGRDEKNTSFEKTCEQEAPRTVGLQARGVYGFCIYNQQITASPFPPPLSRLSLLGTAN